jgi:hypothetical protein
MQLSLTISVIKGLWPTITTLAYVPLYLSLKMGVRGLGQGFFGLSSTEL